MIKFDSSQIGKEVTLGIFPVSATEIREFAEVIEDLNPLYLDPDAARAAGYANVIAPPMFYLRLRGGRMQPEVPLEPGLASVHAGQEMEFTDEIYAGQTYTVTAKIAEVYEKTGRSGTMGIIVREVNIKDSSGKTVVVSRERQIVRSPEKKI